MCNCQNGLYPTTKVINGTAITLCLPLSEATASNNCCDDTPTKIDSGERILMFDKNTPEADRKIPKGVIQYSIILWQGEIECVFPLNTRHVRYAGKGLHRSWTDKRTTHKHQYVTLKDIPIRFDNNSNTVVEVRYTF